MNQSTLDDIESVLGKGRVRQNVSLAPYATFKVGGPAELFFVAESDEDIIAAARAAHKTGVPLTLLGGISNVVIGHRGVKGLVVKNSVSYTKFLDDDDDRGIIRVSGGYSTTRLAKETAEQGYGGLEYHVGLPGTVGGAIAMNSGWYAHKPDVYVGDCVMRARLVRKDGTTHEVDHDYFHFAYDYSVLKDTGELLLWADFLLTKGDRDTLVQRGLDALAHRKKTQPYGVATSGCFFQNVDGVSAGKIIDEAGLKGYSVGGAEVSSKHANFIINKGNATIEDVEALVEHIRRVVKEKTGIILKDEVIYIH